MKEKWTVKEAVKLAKLYKAKFIAMDGNGDIYLYDVMPIPSSNYKISECWEVDYQDEFICIGEAKGSWPRWDKSLIDVGSL